MGPLPEVQDIKDYLSIYIQKQSYTTINLQKVSQNKDKKLDASSVLFCLIFPISVYFQLELTRHLFASHIVQVCYTFHFL